MKWINGILAVGGIGATVIGQTFPSPSGSEFLVVLGSLMIIFIIVERGYSMMANRRKVRESDEPKRRILPDPIGIRSVHDLVYQPQFEKLEKECNHRLAGIYASFEKRDEILHKLEERTQHTSAFVTQTNQRLERLLENLPEMIAKAIDRTRPHK